MQYMPCRRDRRTPDRRFTLPAGTRRNAASVKNKPRLDCQNCTPPPKNPAQTYTINKNLNSIAERATVTLGTSRNPRCLFGISGVSRGGMSPRQGGTVSILVFVLYFKLFSVRYFDCYLWLLGASPPDSHRGSASGPCGGTSVPQTLCMPPLTKSWLRHCSEYFHKETIFNQM